jgi:hypothetical protein
MNCTGLPKKRNNRPGRPGFGQAGVMKNRYNDAFAAERKKPRLLKSDVRRIYDMIFINFTGVEHA